MIHDRGKIKWASLMLPEHVEMLQEFFYEEPSKERPVLNEDYVHEMELTLQQALQSNHKVKLSYYQNGSFEFVIGHIVKLQSTEKKITIQEASVNKKFPFDNIVAIELLNE